jgi:chromate transporter
MTAVPSLAECARTWGTIGALSFGGPAGQIALMQKTLVDEKKWIEPQQFSNGLNFCMLLPGPEAQQLATYCGWLLHGFRGACLAGALFIIPGALVMLALSFMYVTLGQTPAATGILLGIKAVVLVIVAEALHRISKRTLKQPSDWAIAACAFFALAFFQVPFPLVIIVAGLFGYWRAPENTTGSAITLPAGHLKRSAKVILIGLAVWLAPLGAIILLFGTQSVFASLTLFFSKMAVVTFGGAYAVLSYVAQQAVENYHWLSPAEMADGLGLAETTPGPLILVTQHVGFLAGWRQPELFSPAVGAALGAALTTWATFIPSFIFIMLGAPYVTQIGQRPKLAGALSGITAAVLGVILNMALWFALHVLFAQVDMATWGLGTVQMPTLSTFQTVPMIIAAIAAVLTLRLHFSMPLVVLCGGILGYVFSYLV